MKFGFIVYIFAAFNLVPGNGQDYAAQINMAGYVGNVTFSQNSGDFDVKVAFSTQVNTDLFDTFAITRLPPIFGRSQNTSEVCQNLGPVERTLNGVSVLSEVTVPNLSSDDVFGRGLLITSSSFNTRLCAAISLINAGKTYYAKFIGPIVGEVWIRTRPSPPGMSILSDLAYSDALDEPMETSNFTLTGDAVNAIGSSFSTRCQSLVASTSTEFASIPVGNSVAASGKRNAVFVPSLPTGETNLGLFNSDDQTIVSCTNLNEVKPKSVKANVLWDNVRGTIVMEQNSPFEGTFTTIAFMGITETPAGFHVHEFPVPQRRNQKEQRCSVANVGGHFNPYGVVIANSPSSGSSDQYEVGDLSGKYGSLTGDTSQITYSDWNLPLYGVNSVVGRSIVVHYPNGSRWVCANIGHPSDVVTAVVKFKQPAYGYIYFRQASNDFDTDTTVFGELANLNNSPTANHNYHVHLYPIGTDCASAGPHYDPAGLGASANYPNICSPDNPFQCEIGDLSGRHSGVNIGSSLTKFFVTDSNLPLQGPFSIVGRSVVIHDPNAAAPRYACSNITTVWTTSLKTKYNTWKGNDSDGTVTGNATLTQNTEYDITHVTSQLSGLGDRASGYHIHILPISAGTKGIDQCSDSSVQGHYNPFDVPTILPHQFTYDKYEVGDLSSKYGTLQGRSDPTTIAVEDNNLPITSHALSAAGRSLVIHHPDGSRWKCNDIDMYPTSSSGFVITAEASFKDPAMGYVQLRQVVYEDGFASPTTVLVSLSNPNLTETLNHNWHIHIDPVVNQDECDVALGHFDPYMAKTSTADYQTQCNKDNPFACEVGDLSNKLGQYSIDGVRRLYVDEDVPLHTKQTVLGRSVVFHAENGGASRLFCANIIPTEAYTFAYPSSVEYDYYQFTSAVANAMSISRRRVVILHNTDVPVNVGGCSKVMVHIAGSVDGDFPAFNPTDMTPYASTDRCKNEKGATVVAMSSNSASALKMPAAVLAIAMTALIPKMFC